MVLIKLITCFLPWSLKRLVLIKIFRYDIHKNARIGFSWIFPSKLIMYEYSRIDHLTVAINLDEITLGEYSNIGRSNWITGFSTKKKSRHFEHQRDSRIPCLIIGKHSSITKQHHIDCTNQVIIGSFTTVAGYNSQLLTHSINIEKGRQDSNPILIGDYCFLGTNVVVLSGSVLPSYTVLGAKSLLNKAFSENYCLYGGVPAVRIKELASDLKYFNRDEGFIF